MKGNRVNLAGRKKDMEVENLLIVEGVLVKIEVQVSGLNPTTSKKKFPFFLSSSSSSSSSRFLLRKINRP